jgi:hypothetical protein
MDPYLLKINADYRERELMADAAAERLARTARADRSEAAAATLRDLHGRVVGFARRLGRQRRATASRKATL